MKDLMKEIMGIVHDLRHIPYTRGLKAKAKLKTSARRITSEEIAEELKNLVGNKKKFNKSIVDWAKKEAEVTFGRLKDGLIKQFSEEASAHNQSVHDYLFGIIFDAKSEDFNYAGYINAVVNNAFDDKNLALRGSSETKRSIINNMLIAINDEIYRSFGYFVKHNVGHTDKVAPFWVHFIKTLNYRKKDVLKPSDTKKRNQIEKEDFKPGQDKYKDSNIDYVNPHEGDRGDSNTQLSDKIPANYKSDPGYNLYSQSVQEDINKIREHLSESNGERDLFDIIVAVAGSDSPIDFKAPDLLLGTLRKVEKELRDSTQAKDEGDKEGAPKKRGRPSGSRDPNALWSKVLAVLNHHPDLVRKFTKDKELKHADIAYKTKLIKDRIHDLAQGDDLENSEDFIAYHNKEQERSLLRKKKKEERDKAKTKEQQLNTPDNSGQEPSELVKSLRDFIKNRSEN